MIWFGLPFKIERRTQAADSIHSSTRTVSDMFHTLSFLQLDKYSLGKPCQPLVEVFISYTSLPTENLLIGNTTGKCFSFYVPARVNESTNHKGVVLQSVLVIK